MKSPFIGSRLSSLLASFVICLVVIACCLSFLNFDKLHARRLESKSYIRQMYSAFTLAQSDFRLRIFSQWNTSPSIEKFKEGPVHLSYSSLSNFPNTLIAKFSQNKSLYSTLNLGLGCMQISMCAAALYYTIKSHRPKSDIIKSQTVLASITLLLFLTNPASLMMLIEPDVEDSFIFLLFFGSILLHFGSVKFSKIIFFISSFLYPLGAGALIVSFFLSKASVLLSSKLKSAKTFMLDVVRNRNIPLSPGISIYPVIIGFFSYFVARLIYIACDQRLTQTYTGSSLFARIGLDPGDQFYGGILGIFRFAIPFSGFPNGLVDVINLRELGLNELWALINHVQIAIVYGLISMAAFVFAILTITRNKKAVLTLDYIIPNLFLVLTLSIILFLPQWSSVHFRLVARFFAPAMSFYLGYLIYSYASRLKSVFSNAYTLAIIVTSLISLDQIHFFAKWMVFTS